MALAFRNLDVSPDDPVETWGFEGLLTAVDRGSITDWRRIVAVVDADPRGGVADTLADVLDVAEDVGAAAALRLRLTQSRDRADAADRAQVSNELRELWQRSGLTQEQFARRLGTSRTRLNAYLNGRTVPLATVLVRARRLAD